VAKAAMKSGVARKPIKDMDAYRTSLRGRLDPTAATLERIFAQVRANPKRVVFAEGEEESVIRAALAFRGNGYGTAVLIGRDERIRETMTQMGLQAPPDLEVHNARLSKANKAYADYLYGRLQRQGMLQRDCQRLVNQDRNVFAACMVACGDADALVTGATRNYFDAFEQVKRVLGAKPGQRVFGLSMLISRGKVVFIADTTAHAYPSGEEMADIAIQSATKARQMGQEPRVALLSFSNFGNPMRPETQRVRDAVTLLDQRKRDFEYDGEMSADVALDMRLMRDRYPFCRLTGPANVLVMPGLYSANLSSQLLEQLGGGIHVGPLIMGLAKPAQILEMGSTVSDLVNLAALAAHEAIG
jgi:malate dehydrogenase (oxaloacetate-decarboxylating)(NADP+)